MISEGFIILTGELKNRIDTRRIRQTIGDYE